MTQTIFPFLHSPIEFREFLQLYTSVYRDGVITGSGVTAGTNPWFINVGFGEVMIGGSYVDDDLDKLDELDLAGAGDRWYIIEQRYTPTDTDPPAASSFHAVAGTPGAPPVLTAGAIKLADVFIPAAAVNINDPLVRIVDAPNAHGPNKTVDTGEIIERLVMSNGNYVLYTNGNFRYDDAAQNLIWTDDLVFQSQVTFNREEFEAPALVRSTLPAGSSPLSIPGTPGSEDALIYAIIDRSSPDLTAAMTLKVLDLTASPAPVELDDFYDPSNQTSLIIIALVKDGKLHMGGSVGTLPALPGAPVGQVIAESPLGVSAFQSLKDIWMEGGLRVQDWDLTTYPNGVDQAFTALIDASRRKSGMIVRGLETDVGNMREQVWNGADFNDMYQPVHGSIASRWGLGVISGCEISSPAGTNDVVIGTGRFVDPLGRVIDIDSPVTVTIGSDATHCVYWDSSANAFANNSIFSDGVTDEDLPFVIAGRTAGSLDRIEDIRRIATGPLDSNTVFTVGTDGGGTHNNGYNTNFKTPFHALAHISCFQEDTAAGGWYAPRVLEIVGEVSIQLSEDLVGTVTVGTGASALNKVDGVGTRFGAYFRVGDWIKVGNDEGEIAVIDSDTEMTLNNNWNGGDAAGANYQRYVGGGTPGSWTVDFGDTIFTDAQSKMRNITVRGKFNDNERPWIYWGQIGGDGVNSMPSGPLFDLGGGGVITGWEIHDLKMSYFGQTFAGAGNRNICFVKDAGPGFHMTDCTLDGTADVTHFLYWEGQSDMGGRSGGSSPSGPTMLERCQLLFPEAGALNNTYLRWDVAPQGQIYLNNCFTGGGTGEARHLFDIADAAAASVFCLFHVNGGRIQDVEDALVRCQDAGGDNIEARGGERGFYFNNVNFFSLGPGTPKAMLGINDPTNINSGPCVFFDHCGFDQGFDFNGTVLATGCHNTNGTVILPPDGQFDNCRWNAIAAQVNDEALPTVEQVMMGVLGGIRHSFALDGTPKSRILYGCELIPFAHVINPSDWIGRPRLHPGAILMPNGQVASFDSVRVKSLAPDGAGPANTDINGLTPGYAGNQLLYFFARYNRDVAGGENVALVFDQDPPDKYGRPQATTEAGFTVSDYAYVGLLIAETWGGTDSLAGAGEEVRDAMRRVWENCSVVYTGTGQRTVSPASIAVPGIFQATTFHGPAITGNGNDDGIIVPSSNHATLNTDPFAHAKGYQMSIRFEAVAQVGESGTFELRGNRFYRSMAVVAETTEIVSVEFETPIRGHDIYSRLVSSSIVGTISVGTRALIIAVIEDLNSLGEAVQIGSGWPQLAP